jgi:ArsR family transcriptional regulator, arsenate/arsenite/antimonite-responsive transcriptional repressor / arsenate reductase (thioredoxin)
VIPVSSGGTRPSEAVHPFAVRVAATHGIDLSEVTPRVFEGACQGDLVVAVCDHAYESNIGARLHWSVADPARSRELSAFEITWSTLAERVDRLSRSLSSDSSH